MTQPTTLPNGEQYYDRDKIKPDIANSTCTPRALSHWQMGANLSNHASLEQKSSRSVRPSVLMGLAAYWTCSNFGLHALSSGSAILQRSSAERVSLRSPSPLNGM